jgi:hypothetical protein
MKLSTFTNQCSNCRRGIEFAPSSVGEQTTCPHCHDPITLTFPSDQECSATKAIELYLQSSVFPTKRSELFLLRQFANFPTEPDALRGTDNWRTALRAEPTTIVCRFVEQRMLQDGGDNTIALLQTKSANELRGLAEERGLGKSGTKEVLSKRLLANDPQGMRELFRSKTYLICTQKGHLIVDKYLESECEIKAQCEQATMSALMEGRLREACLLVASFEASRVFPRGIGINWREYDCNHDLAVLERIYAIKPSRLACFDLNAVLGLRIGASMMHLWGVNKVPACVPNSGPYLSVESRMLLFSALGFIRLQEMKRVGIKRAKVLASGLPDTCAICTSADGKTYPIDSAPTLPHEKCTCAGGCGCLIVADQ